MWRALNNRVPGFYSQKEVWDLGIRVFQSSFNVQSRLRTTDLHHFPGHHPNVYFITLLGADSVTLPPLPAHSSQPIMNPKRGTWARCWSCIFPKPRMFLLDVCYSYPNFLYLLLPAPPANLPLSQPPGLNAIHACCLSFYLWDHKNDHFCFHISSVTFSMIFYILIGSLFLSVNEHAESIRSKLGFQHRHDLKQQLSGLEYLSISFQLSHSLIHCKESKIHHHHQYPNLGSGWRQYSKLV